MRQTRDVALVCEGPVRSSSLVRLPHIGERLGWVRSVTTAAAGRAASTLRGGAPVRDFEEMEAADIFLISVPENSLPMVISDMAGSEVDWSGKTVALYDSLYDHVSLGPLRRRGAKTATINNVPSLDGLQYLLEGEAEAIRKLRKLIEYRGTRILELRSKTDYIAAVHTATAEFLPLVASAVDSFVASGMDKATAENTAASLFDSSIKAYFRVGRRLLKSPGPVEE